MATIFKLQPTGLSEIIFEPLDGVGSIIRANNSYYAPRDQYNFNETDRIDVFYSDTRLGGRAVNSRGRLVAITFDVFVAGSTKTEMLQNVHTLRKAISNQKGGYLEYRPDGASISTFFRYEMSKPPRVNQVKTNNWDAISAENNKFVIALEVELMTHPYATSGTFQDITPTRTTLDNTYVTGTYTNYFDLVNIKGDLPAYIQLKINNLQSGVNEEINRFYLIGRSLLLSSSLDNIKQVYEAEDAVKAGWTNIADANRSNGQYERITLSSGISSLRFSIPNETDHRGRASVFAVVKSTTTAVKGKVGFYLNNSLIWTSTTEFAPELINKWHIVYFGEIDIPPTSISDNTVFDSPEISLDFRATSGSPVLEVDFMALVFSDETVIQFNVSNDRTYGLGSYQYIFTEVNDDKRVTQIIDTADNVDGIIASVYGSLGIEVLEDTRFFTLFERVNDSHLHVPGDKVEISTKVLYRTIVPFD